LSSNTDSRTHCAPSAPHCGGQGVRCTALTSAGQPCKAWAVRGSDPPRCAAHKTPGSLGGAGKTGAPPGNRDRRTQGFDAEPAQPIAGIDDLLRDGFDKQARLAAYIEAHATELDIADLARLLAVHGQNATRLGRLLRDKRALSGESADGLLDALGKALDELSTELGVKL